jgi:hypothetical protein
MVSGADKDSMESEGQQAYQLYPTDKILSNKESKFSKGPKGVVDGLYGGESVGNVELDPQQKEDTNSSAAIGASNLNRIVAIHATTIGYPQLVPGVMFVEGLGARYSGKYSVLQVKHVISEKGYITEFRGDNFSSPFGEIDTGTPDRGDDNKQVAYNVIPGKGTLPIDKIYRLKREVL